MAGDHVSISHGHLDRTVTQDRLQRRDVAGCLEKCAGEGMAQIVAPERHACSPGDPSEDIGEGGEPTPITVPEDVVRGDVSGCADKCADGGVAERHHPWA